MSTSSSQQSNIWFSISIGLMGLIVGYALASIPVGGGTQKQVVQAPTAAPTNPTPSVVPTAGPVPPVDPKNDHIRGNPNAKYSLITYSDYECPFSKRHQTTLSQLESDYQNKDVNFVYRYYPLSFHQNAEKESEAAQCAYDLGGEEAFWKFTDGIYAKTTSNGTGFALADLGPLAASIGLDQAKFQSCLDSGKEATIVQAEEAAGQKAGVTGTPSNILMNNSSHTAQTIPGGAKPEDAFKTVIDAALKS